MNNRNIGALSLAIVAGGFVTMAIGGRFLEYGSSKFWQILQEGLMAGTIGGVADWFAVTALFKKVPIPIIRRHTNIIINNRCRITSGIVEMVEQKWLSREIIADYLARFSASGILLGYLEREKNRRDMAAALRDVIGSALKNIKPTEFEEFVSDSLRRDLKSMNIGLFAGKILHNSLEHGDHEMLIDAFGSIIHDELRKADRASMVKNIIERAIRTAVWKYRADASPIKSSIVLLAEATALIDYADLTEKVYSCILDESSILITDRKHPLRLKLSEMLDGIASDLAANRGEAARLLVELHAKLPEKLDMTDLIARVVDRTRESLICDLEKETGLIAGMMDRILAGASVRIKEDPELQSRLDGWMRKRLLELVDMHHGEIGRMVRSSLAKLDDQTLVRQIEEKVGNDLQYIRLNGAVIGALAGVLIAIAKAYL